MEYETRQENYKKFKDIAYYLIIGLVSLASVIFLPFLGSTLAGTIIWPVGWIEWLIWGSIRVAVATINIVIFYSFLTQAKVNIKEDKNYIEAIDTLNKVNKNKELKPRSPGRYFGKIWGTKGTILFLSSIASSIILTQAILMFELVAFLSYTFTVFMSVIFGYLQMRATEDYWTTEFLAYANDELRKIEIKSSEDKEC